MIRSFFTILLAAVTLFSQAHAEEIKLRATMPSDHTPRGDWWSIYQDETLNGLMQSAAKANNDIKVAALRFEQARALAKLARSAFFPSVNLNPSINNQSTSGNTIVPFDPAGRIFSGNTFNVPLDVSYELDIWGRVRLGHTAAKEDAAAAAALIHQVTLAVQAEVAQNYFGLRALDAEIHHLQAAIKLLTEAENIAAAKQKAGTATDVEIARAKGETAAQQATLVALRSQREQLQNAIAVLCASKPSSFSIASRGAATLTPPSLPAAVPSDLLQRRPDIAAAQRALNASIARLNIAKLAGYPSLSLGGNAAFTSGKLSTLFTSGSENWIIGPVLNLPIFSGGKNAANLASQTAATEIALVQYQQTILLSFAEVENQLTALKHFRDQLGYQVTASQQADKARDVAKARYESGAGTYLESLDAQRNSIQSQRLIQQTRGQELIASVTLVKAIGGGWNSKLPSPPTPQVVAKSPEEESKKPGFFRRLFSR